MFQIHTDSSQARGLKRKTLRKYDGELTPLTKLEWLAGAEL